MIGIGGIGMSGLARIALKQGHEVSGSDIAKKDNLNVLIDQGALISNEQVKENINQEMSIVYSSAVKEDNPEYQQAKKLGCELLHRSDLLDLFTRNKKTLTVTGTHGKTTTSALLASVFLDAGYDPGYAVGGILKNEDNNGSIATSDYFIIEADESDGTHVKYRSFAAIMTNLEAEHLDHYGALEALEQSFHQFINNIESEDHFFWCGDCKGLRSLDLKKGINYGMDTHNELMATNFKQIGWKSYFDARFEGKIYKQIEVSLVGKHNVLNALAVFGLSLKLGLDESDIRKGLASFKGVLRRLDIVDEVNSILIIDDYAHHPTEIEVMLHSLKDAVGERRLVAVYQPHRYTRTQNCIDLFKNVFDYADELIVTDIYSAGERPNGVTHQDILDRLNESSSLSNRHVPRNILLDFLGDFLRPHDVVVTIGAGDITTVSRNLSMDLKKKSSKIRIGLIAGGRSQEHEVSLSTVNFFSGGLDPNLYEVTKFGITHLGMWVMGDNIFDANKIVSDQKKSNLCPEIWQALEACDCFIPVLHGPYGEDGMLQGFLETLGKAFVACNRNASALAMNKAWTKKILQHHGILTTKFLDFSEFQWQEEKERVLSKIKNTLSLPLYVKPVHLGSSIGVTKVSHAEELSSVIKQVLQLDTHFMVEEEVIAREIEVSIVGDQILDIANPGEVGIDSCSYSYEAKYGLSPIKKKVQADLSEDVVIKVKDFAKKVYRITDCSVLARVDLFIDSKNRIFLNEINPMPGCGPNSLYHRMLLQSGFTPYSLLNRLVIAGLAHFRRLERKNHRSLKKIGKEVVPHAFK